MARSKSTPRRTQATASGNTDPGGKHRTANLVGVKLLAQRLDVPVEVGIVPASDSTVCRKGARRSAAGLARPPTSTPASHDVVVCPSPCATVAVRVIDRVDLNTVATMPTPFESALLNLQLFKLRREPVLREARDWFLREFNPESFDELISLVSGERNASFRMVLGYWNMAASLVTTGAIDANAFLAAHGEVFATFSKIHPFLSDLRHSTGELDFCKHVEAVVMAAPNAEAILARRRDAARAAAKQRRSE
jgi:hypothetical protein